MKISTMQQALRPWGQRDWVKRHWGMAGKGWATAELTPAAALWVWSNGLQNKISINSKYDRHWLKKKASPLSTSSHPGNPGNPRSSWRDKLRSTESWSLVRQMVPSFFQGFFFGLFRGLSKFRAPMFSLVPRRCTTGALWLSSLWGCTAATTAGHGPTKNE